MEETRETEQPQDERTIRQAVIARLETEQGLAPFLARLGRFGLTAGMPPLLSRLNPGK